VIKIESLIAAGTMWVVGSQPGLEALTAVYTDNRRIGRMNLLFAILVMVYVQYLFIFEGQEKIVQSMPVAYSAVVNGFEGFLGRTNVGGTIPGENSRLY
tara:strand:+ start:236 stop:532 length:297 start_codon:yes stop_codon:yes gene_type:complete